MDNLGKFNIIGNDIPYQDGVLEILKGNSNIDFLILNEELIGEYNIRDFINMILNINKKIEIIFIMFVENLSLRRFLEKKGIFKIFINEEFEIDNIVELLVNGNNNLSYEIENLKNLINSERKNKKLSSKSKVIAISGNYGSGKSLITSLLGKSARKNNIKTIIIDFDVINNSINTIFRIRKYKEIRESNDIENFITHISSNLDIFCGIDFMFTEKNKICFEKVEKLFDDLKERYDLILVDTSSETQLKYTKIVFSNVDKIIFLIEPNLLEVKKAENLLEIYINDWEINPNKIEILLNKVNVNSIDIEILNEIMGKIKIIGKINFSIKFTELANNIRESDLGLKKYMKILQNINIE